MRKTKKTPKKFNHMFDVAFTCISEVKNPHAVPVEEMITALEARVKYLRTNPDECAEAFGYSDSFEIPED